MQITYIGTGAMGKPMISQLIEHGYTVKVTDKYKSAAETVISKGAIWADTPKEAALVYDRAVIKYKQSTSKLNFPIVEDENSDDDSGDSSDSCHSSDDDESDKEPWEKEGFDWDSIIKSSTSAYV